MDFDSTFNFTRNIEELTQRNDYFASLIADAQAQNEQLLSLTEYTQITAPRIQSNNETIASYTSSISQNQNLLNNLTNIQSLPSQTKQVLYDFYIIIGIDKSQFAEKFLSNNNYIGMSESAAPIIADQTITLESKTLLLNIVYFKYVSNVSLIVSL